MVRKRVIAMRVANGAFFYGGWAVCMWSAAEEIPWVGVGAILLIIALHLAVSPQRLKDVILVVALSLAGTVLDTLYQTLGLLQFESPNLLVPWMAPLWITSLYALTAINVDHSLVWLQGRPILTALLGASGAEATYLAGVRMGAAEFTSHYTWLVIILVWLVFFPAVYYFSAKLDTWLARNGDAPA